MNKKIGENEVEQTDTTETEFVDDLADFDTSTMDIDDEEDVETSEEEEGEDDSDETEEDAGDFEDAEEEEGAESTGDDSETEDEEAGEGDDEEDIVAALRSEISRLQAQQLERAQAQTPKNDGAPAGEVDSKSFDFLDGYDFEEVVSDPAVFNDCLGKAVEKVLSASMNNIYAGAIEKMQVALPTIVSTQIDHQDTLRKAADNFYSQHEQLSQHKPLVASHITSVANENPDWDLTQVMAEAATRSYKQLRLTSIATKRSVGTKGKTEGTGLRRPKKSGRPASSRAVSSLQKELDELDAIQSQF